MHGRGVRVGVFGRRVPKRDRPMDRGSGIHRGSVHARVGNFAKREGRCGENGE